MKAGDTHLLSCDWGTSNFRLRLVNRQTKRIEAEHASPDGAKTIASAHPKASDRRGAFAAVLDAGLTRLQATHRKEIPLIVSGMAASTIGWMPLPYASVPARLDGADFVTRSCRLNGRLTRFISGLCTATDVLRGEECELTGLFTGSPRRLLAEDSCAVLPGTHSKHVRLRRGRIASFTTHPTGELFALLTQHSTLCAGPAPGFSAGAFRAGVQAARRLGLGAAVFQARARTVLGTMRAADAADFLSGVLIGAELTRLPAARRLVLATGNPVLLRRYRIALAALGLGRRTTVIPAAEAARAVVRGHLQLARFL